MLQGVPDPQPQQAQSLILLWPFRFQNGIPLPTCCEQAREPVNPSWTLSVVSTVATTLLEPSARSRKDELDIAPNIDRVY